MQLKTYRARSAAEALAAVKSDLGPEAVILHTRTISTGGVLRRGASEIEITAGVDPSIIPMAARPRRASAAQRPTSTPDLLTKTYLPPRFDAPAAQSRVEYPLQARDLRHDQTAPSRLPLAQPSDRGQDRANDRGLDHPAFSARPDLDPLSRRPGEPDALALQRLRLLEQDVAGEIADEVIASLRDRLSARDLSDPARLRACLLEALAALTPCDGTPALLDVSPDGRPLTIALVGPTGAGKTTTIAKLCAGYALRLGVTVGLITADTSRLNAADQLRAYADIIGVPLLVADTPAAMAEACRAFSDRRVILIDTPGRSPNDRPNLEHLAQLLAAARPHRTHLVLSAGRSTRSMLDAAAAFHPCAPDRVLFTKLDETASFGVLLSVARMLRMDLSYLTTGQDVPACIEPCRPARLARLVMGLEPAQSSRSAQPAHAAQFRAHAPAQPAAALG